MKWLLRLTLALGVLGGSAASAGTVTVDLTVNPDSTLSISLDPVGGILSGNPGDTVGWGFDLTTVSAYGVLVNASDFCVSGPPFVSPCTDSYTDLIGFTNSVSVNAGDSNLSLSQAFDPVNQLGFGSLLVPNQDVVGQLVFYYSLTDNQGNPIPGDSNLVVSVAAEVDVAGASIPEPATMPLLTLALSALAGLTALKTRSRQA